MSKYTTEIRKLRETNFNFGLKDYPIFDETYRAILNKKILDHYHFREIGQETAGMFKFYLNTKMNEIMPYYNTLYKYQLMMLEKDIYNNVDQTEELTRNVEGTSNSKSESASTGASKNKSLNQDTPSGELLHLGNELEDQEYASSFNIDNTENNNAINDNSSANSNNTETYVKRMYGNIGVRGLPEDFSMLVKHLMNIDMEIINQLNTLFMGIY